MKIMEICGNPQLSLSRSKTSIKPIGLLMVLECPWPPNPEIPLENMKDQEKHENSSETNKIGLN